MLLLLKYIWYLKLRLRRLRRSPNLNLLPLAGTQGEIKIGDFGLAKVFQGGSSSSPADVNEGQEGSQGQQGQGAQPGGPGQCIAIVTISELECCWSRLMTRMQYMI